MHHGTEPYGGKRLYLCIILLAYISAKVCIAVLNTMPNGFHAIGPETIHKLILPLVTALRNRLVLLIDEYSLDTGRAQLHAEHSSTLLNGFFCGHSSYFNALFNM